MATMRNGSVSFDGVTAEQFARAMDLKAKHGDALQFDPRTVQLVGNQYNNFTITWSQGDSYSAAHELITMLLAQTKSAVQ